MATKNIVPRGNGEGGLGTAAKGWGGAFLTSIAASSTSAGAKLQLITNDGAVMADTHRLGIIEFLGAEDTSGTVSLGASIEAVADETFTASENASALVFKTTSGTTVSEVLRLDKSKLATFAGNVSIAGNLDVTGTFDLSDSNFTNAGDIKLDSITGDGDADTAIIFSGSNVITFKANNANQLTITDGAVSPVTDSDIDLGTTSLRYKDAFVDSITVTGEVDAASLDIEGNADINGTTNLDVVDIDGAVNMATTALVTGVLTTTATQVANGGITSGSNIVSDTNSTDSLGTTSVRWANLFVDAITATNNLAVGGTGAFTGNVKIGSQDFPAFNNNRNVLVIGQKGSLSSINSSGDIYLNQNVFVDSSGANKAIASGGSAQFRLSDSEILISTGTSPGAGATTVLTPRLTISSTLSTFANNIKIPNSGTIGCAADTNLLTLTDQVLTVAGNVVSSGRLLVTAADGVSNADYVASIRNQEATDGSSFGLTINAGSNASDIALNITDHDAANVLLRVFGNGNSTFGGDLSINGGDLSFSADQNATIGMGQRNDGGRNLDIGAGGAGNGGGSNSNGGSLTLRSGGSKGTGTSTMHFRTSVAANGYGLSTEQMKIDAVGDVSVTNNLFIGSGKAIYVGGTAADNAFDDYEEGTWNPLPFYQNADDQGKALVDQVTANQTAGFYTKIGNMVHVHGSIVWNISEGLSDIAVDNVGVKTLPFASANQTNNFSAITFAINGANTVPSGGFTGELSKNSAILLISSPSQSGNQGRNLGTGDITVKFSCSYRATT